MPQNIQGRLKLFFGAFVALVVISEGALYLDLEAQRQDAQALDLVGRQRTLIQQMTRHATQWSNSRQNDELANLRAAEATFDLTLFTLREGGGNASYLFNGVILISTTRDPKILAELGVASQMWKDLRATLGTLANSASGSSDATALLQIIQNQSAVLLQQTDKVMGAYQSAATEKATRSRIIIQIGFVTSATLLLAFGGWAINRSVISPLKQLQRVTERIGENDFDTQAQIEGPREMRLLAQSFETMRNNLLASKTEMAELAESLERRVAQRTRELEALNEVSREIASHLDVQHVLDLVTEKTRSLLDGEVAALCLMDENDKWLNLQSVNGPKESIIGKRVEVAGSSTDAILHGTQAQLCNGKKCLSGCGILSDDYIASHIIAPLQVGDCVVGALCVGLPEQNRYSNESSSLLTKLASVAAIALDNARLYAQAERVATLEERRRVAAEMHDGLGQTLSYLGLTTEQAMEFLANGQSKIALERLQKMRNVIEKTTGEVRRAINNLMDEAPLAFDLSVRLHSAVDEFTANGLSVTWQAEADVADCPRQVAEQVVNVAREALNNVVRHAQAREVKVKMGKMDSQYFMAVEDDGQGFDSSQAEPQGHFGLQIMQARATHIGGRVQIESTQGCGTRVTLVWPPVGIGE